MVGDFFTVHVQDVFPGGDKMPTFPEILYCFGNRDLLALPRACVLNSRKPRAVKPGERWLEATRAFVERAAEAGYVIVSSLGTLAYAWTSFLALEKRVPLIVVCDRLLPGSVPQKEAFVMGSLPGDFHSRQVLLVSPFNPDTLFPAKLRGPVRDRCVAALSHTVWFAEIRAGGVMEQVADDAVRRGRPVSVFRPSRFDLPTAGNRNLLAAGNVEAIDLPFFQNAEPEFSAGRESEGVTATADEWPDGEYLIHFTRSCPGPWPGQSGEEYFRSLFHRDPGAGHTAFDALARIVREGRIRASARLIRGREGVVSFTACSPSEVLRMRRWNPGLLRWTFEPYGIAVRTSVLRELGIRPVVYAPEEDYRTLPPEERYLFQVHRPPRTDWSNEKEWRLKGDLSLDLLSPRDLVLLVAKEQEKQAAKMVDGAFTVFPL